MKLLPADEQYFREFALQAKAQNVRLEDYYMLIQKSQRNEKGGVISLSPNETQGLNLALQFVQAEDSCIILGCGCGVEASWLLAHGIQNITGLDVAESVLAVCRKNLGIKTVCGDMRKTDLPDQSYDIVLSHRSLHHLFYPFQALEEMARLARKRVSILNEPVRSGVKTVARRLKKARIISAANIYEYQFDREDVHRYMAFNGFRLVSTSRYWETVQSRFVNRLLNALGRSLGNRFSAIYERATPHRP